MNTFADAFTSALIDFVWQGALVAVVLAIALQAVRRRSARVRYVLSTAALAALMALPIVTTAARYAAAPDHAATVGTGQSSLVARIADRDVAAVPYARRDVTPALMILEPWVLPLWSLGVLLLSIRLVVGGIELRQLRRTGRRADQHLRERVSRLAGRMGIGRRIQVVTSTRAEGPSVIGWLRPLILLPPAMAMGLTPSQLDAVLAHELAHVRRHDYLVNIVQTVAETLLFYHPAVWWVSQRMRIERELCCDDEAVGVCGDAALYARALVTIARLHVPAMAMGSAGGSVTDRVQRLLGLRGNESRRSAAFGVVAITAALVSILVATMNGQAEPPRFEVASVKPVPAEATRGFGGVEFLPGGVVRGTRVPLFLLVTAAYDIGLKQLHWESDLLTERFDIDARVDPKALPPEGATLGQTMQALRPVLRERLKSLLAERFKLAIHAEQRDSPVYALVVGPNGHKLTRAARNCAPATLAEATSGVAICGRQGGGPAGGLRYRGVELAVLVDALTAFLDRNVVDRTGIQGRFDIDLPPWNTAGLPRPQGADAAEELQPSQDDPSIFTLLQEQLGLRLESTRAPLDIYVVDHVERPTAN